MYPRNAASPEPIAIGPVVQISDGAVQSSGVTVRVKPIGVTEADGGGTTGYSTDGVVLYTPTQAETNYTSFVLIAKKTGCIPASVTVVTSARSVSGEVQVGGYASGQVPLQPTTAGRTLDVTATGAAGIDLANVENQGSTLNLTGTTIKTATDVETDTQDIQSRLPSGLVGGRIAANAEVVGDKTGYKLASDGLSLVTAWAVAITGNITGDLVGDVTGEVAELGPNALSANSLTDEISLAVWNALTTATYVDQSFGDRVLISANNTRQVAVNGNGHVAGVLHDAEPNSIPEDAFVSGAISARVIATDAIDADALADGAITSGVFAADSITATALATSAGEEIADKVWDEAIAAHLASGSTGEALNNAGGSGNPWITDLATGYTGTQAGNILNQVKAKTDLITTGTIQSSIPVTAQGQITGPLYIGDDYLSANGRAFQWTVALPSGFVIATSTCKFGMELAEGTGGASFNVTGTVIDAGGGNVTLRFDVPKATTGTLEPGFYRWSVEIASAGGNEVTRVASDGKKLVEWREKQT
jgi:hypothetical protein